LLLRHGNPARFALKPTEEAATGEDAARTDTFGRPQFG
jgi:hypothetical protein